jgi:hypothetical protein
MTALASAEAANLKIPHAECRVYGTQAGNRKNVRLQFQFTNLECTGMAT